MVADPNQPKVPITFALSAAEGLHKVALKKRPAAPNPRGATPLKAPDCSPRVLDLAQA